MDPQSHPYRPAAIFAGNERFRLDRLLGSGAFGSVYAAWDHRANSPVAVKVLHRADPAWVYRFKQEFRSLQGVVHSNLASLYELLCEGESWFLTMELIQGTDFLRYINRISAPPPVVSGDATTVLSLDDLPTQISAPAQAPAALDIPRLTDAFHQLTLGIAAIHNAGKLHRDIKPSNVLVEPNGRVAILDFGLIVDSSGSSSEMGGTPRYMSPEQRANRPCPPSDWFAMGVMLYQCLTGRFPFDDGPAPAHPASWNPAVPHDLGALALELLESDPERRPSVMRLLSFFGATPARAAAPAAPVFVGRRLELAELASAFDKSLAGNAVVIRVEGESGIGKSALVNHFLQTALQRFPDTVILTGRCYDRESVPYKALDGVVDSLSQFLQGLPDAEAVRYLPVDTGALTRLFPVLGRAQCIADAPRRSRESTDVQELRRRGAEALREMLARIASARPLILSIDDLQWGDQESALVLETILREPDPPALLLIAGHRGGEAHSNPVLQRLLAAVGVAAENRHLVLGALNDAEARELGPGIDVSTLREARGNPFLISALARGAADTTLSGGVDGFVRAEAARLPESARRLLELVSVAARPLPLDMLTAMPGVDSGPAALSLLRAGRMIRSRYVQGQEEIETYHDRIRESIAAASGPERLNEYHLALARAWSARGDADREDAAMHYAAAGDTDAAARLAEPAAFAAANALAFERAERLFRMALASNPSDVPRRLRLLTGLADALRYTRRVLEAAEVWQQAAAIAPQGESETYRRNAAEYYLLAGHFDTGITVLTAVLAEVGLKLHESRRRLLFNFLVRRAWLRIRGNRFTPRDPATIPASVLRRIDACATVVSGFSFANTPAALDFQTRHLHYALAAGDPWRIANALAFDIPTLGALGARTAPVTRRTIEEARAAVGRFTDPYLSVVLDCTTSWSYFLGGNWKKSIDEMLRIQQAEVPLSRIWALGDSFTTILRGFIYCNLGDFNALREHIGRALGDARERGDLFVSVMLHTPGVAHARLADGDPEAARNELRAALASWPNRSFYISHYWGTHAETDILLYEGNAAEASRTVEEAWPRFVESQLDQVEHIRIFSVHLRGRVALTQSPPQRALAADCAAKIEREKTDWAAAFALLLRAGLAATPGAAAELLARAEAGLARHHMELHLASARAQRARLTGDPAARRDADAYFRLHAVANPAKLTQMICPLTL